MQAYLERLTDRDATNFANKIGDLFKQFPKLPSNITEFIVSIAPYLALISAILSVIGGPLVGLIGTFGSLMAMSAVFMIWTIVTVVLILAQAALLFMAFSPLKARQMKGWMYLFWAEVIGTVQAVISVIGADISGLVVSIIMVIIWFYVLFQMRPYYKN